MSCLAMREWCGDCRHYCDSEKFLICVYTRHVLPPSYVTYDQLKVLVVAGGHRSSPTAPCRCGLGSAFREPAPTRSEDRDQRHAPTSCPMAPRPTLRHDAYAAPAATTLPGRTGHAARTPPGHRAESTGSRYVRTPTFARERTPRSPPTGWNLDQSVPRPAASRGGNRRSVVALHGCPDVRHAGWIRDRPGFRTAEAYVEAAAAGRRLWLDATARPPGIHDHSASTVAQWTITGTNLDQQNWTGSVK